MYKMVINVSGQQRVFLFRGPGCRKAMLESWRDHLLRAEADADVRSIRVWGTVGNKTDIVLEWQRHDEAGTRAAEERTAGRAHSPPPEAASPLSQVEQQSARCRDDARDHPVGRRRARN
jgi:hypothetical protein